MARVDQEQRDMYIAALEKCGFKLMAARTCECSYRAICDERRRNDDFAADEKEALDAYVETLRKECVRRGRDGYLEPQFYQGKRCGVIRKYSDGLLTLELKRRDPGYRERLVDVDVHDGGVLVVNAPAGSVGEWRERHEKED